MFLLSKSGYWYPGGLFQSFPAPAKDIALGMMKSASVLVTVDFLGTPRPEGYIVEIRHEDRFRNRPVFGPVLYSGNINAKNQISFNDITPGRYVVQGRPNPSKGDQQTLPVTIDLKGGQTSEVTLSAK